MPWKKIQSFFDVSQLLLICAAPALFVIGLTLCVVIRGNLHVDLFYPIQVVDTHWTMLAGISSNSAKHQDVLPFSSVQDRVHLVLLYCISMRPVSCCDFVLGAFLIRASCPWRYASSVILYQHLLWHCMCNDEWIKVKMFDRFSVSAL